MQFETVERCGRKYAIVNGVESAGFIERDCGGGWGRWDSVLVAVGSADEGLEHIADAMGNWYTAAEAADKLVEMGVFDKAPTAHDVCMWARNGLLPGSVKVPMPGQGGSWRIPAKALVEFTGRRE